MTFDPDWTIAPGATLKDWREENGLGVKAAARTCRMEPKVYEAIEAGKRRITTPLAVRLYAGTCIPAKLWLNLERRYRDDLKAGKADST